MCCQFFCLHSRTTITIFSKPCGSVPPTFKLIATFASNEYPLIFPEGCTSTRYQLVRNQSSLFGLLHQPLKEHLSVLAAGVARPRHAGKAASGGEARVSCARKCQLVLPRKGHVLGRQIGGGNGVYG